jgi:hypothetical protein
MPNHNLQSHLRELEKAVQDIIENNKKDGIYIHLVIYFLNTFSDQLRRQGATLEAIQRVQNLKGQLLKQNASHPNSHTPKPVRLEAVQIEDETIKRKLFVLGFMPNPEHRALTKEEQNERNVLIQSVANEPVPPKPFRLRSVETNDPHFFQQTKILGVRLTDHA